MARASCRLAPTSISSRNSRNCRTAQKIRAVFHAAALCDYRVKSVHTSGGAEVAATKIPSRAGELTLTLDPAAKLIHDLRDLFPASRIVGWKYELVGSRADVLAAAIRQLGESRSDACVMNGAAYGGGFGFLEPRIKPVHFADKAAALRAPRALAQAAGRSVKRRPLRSLGQK